MAEKGLVKKSTMTAIADAIRAKTGSTDTMTPPEMPGLIDGLETKAEFKKVKLPSVERCGAVGYGGGKYIATAAGGLGAYSEDGVNWTKTTLPAYGIAQDIAYGNGVYVAVALGSVMYSTDGITWTNAILPVENATWQTVCYGNGMFLAGSSNGYLISSEDGINWTQIGGQYSVVGGSPNNLVYGNGMFVFTASSMGEGGAMYSTDGINWEVAPGWPEPNGGGYATCYGGGKFVTLGLSSGYSGDQKPGAYSEDGIYWTAIDLPFELGEWTSVTYGNGVYIGVCQGERDDEILDYADVKKAIYSTDGINWQEIELPVAQKWMSVCYGDNGFVAISEQGAVAHSVDGINWTEAELPITTIQAWTVGYGDGKYVAIYPSYISYSTDGFSWRKTNTPSSDYFTQIAYGNGIFVVTGQRNVLYSSTGTRWTNVEIGSRWAANMALGFGNGKFIVGYKDYNYPELGYSTDGITWEYTTGVVGGVQAICYGKGKYVQIGRGSSGGTLAIAGYSTDGINWTETPMPSDQAWSAACYGKDKFVAIAKNSQYGAYSKDGINWTQMELPSARNWDSVSYGNGMFVATATDSDVAAYSMDGIHWAESSIPLISSSYSSICYGDGKFVAAFGMSVPWCAVCDVTKSLK